MPLGFFGSSSSILVGMPRSDFNWQDYDNLVALIEANVAPEACLNIGHDSIDDVAQTFELAVQTSHVEDVLSFLAEQGYHTYEVIPDKEVV